MNLRFPIDNADPPPPPRQHIRNRTSTQPSYSAPGVEMIPHQDASEDRLSHSLNFDTGLNPHHGTTAPVVTESPPNPLLSGIRLTSAIEGVVASFLAESGNSSLDRIQAWEIIHALAQDKVTGTERLPVPHKSSLEVGARFCLFVLSTVLIPQILSGRQPKLPSSGGQPTLR